MLVWGAQTLVVCLNTTASLISFLAAHAERSVLSFWSTCELI